MKKINTDWSVKNLIGERGNSSFVQNQLNARYKESLYTFNEPGMISGSMKTFSSPNMELSMMTMSLKKEISIKVSDGIERAGSTFLMRGNIDSPSLFDHRHRKIEHSEHLFTYSLNHKTEFNICTGDTSLLNINLKPAFLQSLLQEDDTFKLLLGNSKPEDHCISFQLNAAPWSAYQQIVNSIYSNTFTGISQHLFLEAKAFEILAMQLHDLGNFATAKKIENPISKADQEKLHAVNKYIHHNYIEDFSLSELALKFQLNDFKLKKGYKALFNNTVFGQVQQLRMEQAKKLLSSGDYNVAQVAYAVGYSSPNNFSTAFAKMYNYSPRHILQKCA